MNSQTYIKTRQILWARSQGIPLRAKYTNRGADTYTLDLNDNLYHPLTSDVKMDFLAGDGGELGTGNNIGNMFALYSSSALTVNVFTYWRTNGDLGTLAKALRIPSTQLQSL